MKTQRVNCSLPSLRKTSYSGRATLRRLANAFFPVMTLIDGSFGTRLTKSAYDCKRRLNSQRRRLESERSVSYRGRPIAGTYLRRCTNNSFDYNV